MSPARPRPLPPRRASVGGPGDGRVYQSGRGGRAEQMFAAADQITGWSGARTGSLAEGYAGVTAGSCGGGRGGVGSSDLKEPFL